MSARHLPFALSLALIASLSTVAARAADDHVLGQHPAVLQQHRVATIDANTFIVAHPAGLALRTGHANHDHPAVAAARSRADGTVTPVDTNLFLVQPPASTHWTLGPAAEPTAATLAQITR